MGAFIILAVILFPYYQKLEDAPSTEEFNKLSQKVAAAQSTAEQQLDKLGKIEQKVHKLKPKDIEVVFVLDTTMSMQNEIESLKRHIKDVAHTLSLVNKKARIGFVAFRDAEEARKNSSGYATKVHPMREMTATNLQSLNRFVQSLSTGSGGDTAPESLSLGMQKALAMDWTSGDSKHIIVVITDAKAKDEARALALANEFSTNTTSPNPKKVSVILANTRHANLGRSYLQSLAKAGNGEFIEDSGRMLTSLLKATLSP